MIVQSFMLYKLADSSRQKSPLYNYQMLLIHALLARANALEAESVPPASPPTEPGRRAPTSLKRKRELAGHIGKLVWLAGSRDHRCDACRLDGKLRSRAHVTCVECGLYFCHSKDRDCFASFHACADFDATQ
jgi:hypothetical protein